MGLMMKAVFDTNILIDYCNGINKAKKEIELYSTRVISVITWMELLVGAKNKEEEVIIRTFLNEFEITDIIIPIRGLAISIRKEMSIKLPDAIILATARHHEAPLITRNTKDFPQKCFDIRVPYTL